MITDTSLIYKRGTDAIVIQGDLVYGHPQTEVEPDFSFRSSDPKAHFHLLRSHWILSFAHCLTLLVILPVSPFPHLLIWDNNGKSSAQFTKLQ